ncbi:MAG: protein TolQ [Alphaproteobacteria bacterium]
MNSRAVDAVQMASGGHDLSIIGLFMMADLVVKAIMIMLFFSSIWCWAIIIDKSLRLRTLKQKADEFEDSFWASSSLDSLYERVSKKIRDPMAAVFAAGMREWQHAVDKGLPAKGVMSLSLGQRVDRIMQVTIGREMERVESSMTFLATVGSTAPFVGLFGTVWGIMNSFTAIAGSQNTSLAVVAPGIAEALFATALGLVAAIPAVVAYNKFGSEISRYGDRLDAFSSEFSAILSRSLEENKVAA